MAAKIEKLSLGIIEQISKILGDTSTGLTGNEINNFLIAAEIHNPYPEITKWRRLYEALIKKQMQDSSANKIFYFIQIVMEPARNIHNAEWFEETRSSLNEVLSFAKIKIGDDGKFRTTTQSITIDEAKSRASSFRSKLLKRNVHPMILKYCRDELLTENYFHAVFEATKSLADQIRERTGLALDGGKLVDEAFSYRASYPYLAINTLQSENDESEHKGFMNLLKGIFGMFRNTTAHYSKIKYTINEKDALDIMTVISLAHRKIENATEPKNLFQKY